MSGLFEFGARFEILLAEKGDDSVRYLATISLPDGRKPTMHVDLPREEGPPVLSDPSEPDAVDKWMALHVLAMSKTFARKAQRGGAWPRRLCVWKEAPAKV